jgi:MFS family permease
MITVFSISSRSAVRRVAAARLISGVGSEAAFTALLFVLYRRTGSAAWVSAALLATFGTIGILTPLAGSLGDRFDRQRIMISSDVLGAACFAALAVARSPGQLVALGFLAAAAESPFLPASGGAIPNLAGAEELAWANGTVQAGHNLGHVVGPFLGGALVAAFGGPFVFWLNAASFLLSAVLVAGVRGPFAGDRQDAHLHQGIRAGFRFLVRDRVLLRMTLAFTVFVLAVGSVLVAELPLVASFHAGAFGYGLIGTFWGTGALAGALAARRLTERTERTALVACSFVTAAGIGAIALLPSFAPILLALLVSGFSDSVVDVTAETLIQRRAPDAVRSRVSAAVEGVVHIVFAVSFLFAAAVVVTLGPRAAYAIAGAGCGVAAVILVPLLRPTDASQA